MKMEERKERAGRPLYVRANIPWNLHGTGGEVCAGVIHVQERDYTTVFILHGACRRVEQFP